MRVPHFIGSLTSAVLSSCLIMTVAMAQSADAAPGTNDGMTATAMNNERLGRLLSRVDEAMTGEPGFWQLNVEGRTVLVVTDEAANRMRIMSVVMSASLLDEAILFRIMQANFDTSVDARYAIAKGLLWTAFLHPLDSLSDEQVVSGLAQVVNLANTYGTTFSAGALTYGGGDSEALLQRLREKALSI